MKLTNAIRTSITNAVTSDTFDKKVASALAVLKQEVIAYINNSPDYLTDANAPEQYLPFMEGKTRIYLYRRNESNISMSLDFNVYLKRGEYSIINDKTAGEYNSPALNAYQLTCKQRDSFGVEIYQVLKGINTSKQLAEIMPALTKYLPAQDAINFPVPIAQIDRLSTIIAAAKE